MPLSDRAIQALKPAGQAYKKADGKGLTLLVGTDGGKHWRFRYRVHGKEKMLSLGAYPEVPLSAARAERDRLRGLLAAGQDPSLQRRTEKLKARRTAEDTFGKVASDFVAKREAEGAAWRTIKKHRTLLGPLLRDLGPFPIRDITSLQLLATLRKLEADGHVTMANEARALVGRIYRLAIAQGRAEADIAEPIKGALQTPVIKGHASITAPEALGNLLLKIESYKHCPIIRDCLLLLAHLFVRPGELREAHWMEFSFDQSTWRIPAQRTKLRRDHIVPLSPSAIRILQRLQGAGLGSPLVVPSPRMNGKPLSDMAFNKALRSIGYGSDVHVAHGFRSTASTLLNEQGYNSDWIERQLAHVERNKVRGAYNAAQYLEGRTRMMNEWSAYLDRLADQARAATSEKK